MSLLLLDDEIRSVSDIGGIASSAAMGAPSVGYRLEDIGGIASSEAVGTPTVRSLVQRISGAGGIASTAAMGDMALLHPGQTSFATLSSSNDQIVSFQNQEAVVKLSAGYEQLHIERIDVDDPGSPRPVVSTISSGLTVTSHTVASDLSYRTTLSPGGNPALFEVVIDAEIDHAAGSITMKPEFTMGATYSPAWALHFAALNYRFDPFGDPADCVVVIADALPRLVTLTQLAALAGGGEYRQSFPGIQNVGGEHPNNPPGDIGYNQSDEPSSWIASSGVGFFEYLHFYNKVTKIGVLVFPTDIQGQGKVQVTGVYPDGSLGYAIRMVPQDHSVGKNNASDTTWDYGFRIIPMVGDWYDSLVTFREARKALGALEFSGGKLRDRSDYPERMRDAAVFCALTTGGGDTLPTGFSFEMYLEAVEQLIDGLEVAPELVVVSIYDYWLGLTGADFPAVRWEPEAGLVIQAIYALGVTTLLYSIIWENAVYDLSEDTGLPPGLAINDNLSLDRNGAPITGESSIVPGSSGGFVYINPDWSNDVNTRSLYAFFLDQLIAEIGVSFHGVYDDANAFAPPPNDNPALLPADRGFGSTTWATRNRNRIGLWRDEMIDHGISDPIVTSEHPMAPTIGAVDMIFDNAVGPGVFALPGLGGYEYANSVLPATAIMYSEYSVISSYSTFGVSPDDLTVLDVEDFATVYEFYAAVFAQLFHRGVVPSFLRFFSNSLTNYFDADMSEGADQWRLFMKMLFVDHVADVRHYRQRRKIRELPGSQVEIYNEAYLTQDTYLALSKAAKLTSSAWCDDDVNIPAVFLVNWSLPIGYPTMRTCTAEITTASHPELGTSPRIVRARNFVTGDSVTLAPYDGQGVYSFNLAVPPATAYFIELIPAATPDLGRIASTTDMAKNILVTWFDDPSETLDYYEVIKGPGGTTVAKTKSAVFLDTTEYLDSAAISAATFDVSATRTDLVPTSYDLSANASSGQAKWPVAKNSICMISGTIAALGGAPSARATVRIEVAPADNPSLALATIFLSRSVAVTANFVGEFVLPAPRNSVIWMRCRDAEFSARAIVPDSATATLDDLEFIPMAPTTNT